VIISRTGCRRSVYGPNCWLLSAGSSASSIEISLYPARMLA
jgi:hypothetical protein